MSRRILITGCSGGGKSTLLAALAKAGQATVAEPGRRIVQEETSCGGNALPWADPLAFCYRALAVARADLERARGDPVFFDRGLIDAAVALHHLQGTAVTTTLGGPTPYSDPVFLAPPWPEIYATDPDRRHALDAAVEEYHRLDHAVRALGHRVLILPRVPVAERLDFVLTALR
jgi:predicted ATPase